MAVAPKYENTPMMKALLEAGARPDDSSHNHVTLLMEAVECHSPQTVQMLLDHGANPMAKDDDGRNPIYYFIDDDPDRLKIAEMLVKWGSDVNAVDNEGQTALLTNCYYRRIHIARFLIAHGARVNVTDEDGDTPLLDCFQFPQSSDTPDIVKLLIAHGANVNQCNKAGQTPLSLAKDAGDKHTIRLLVAAGAKR